MRKRQLMLDIENKIQSTVYAFGSLLDQKYGTMVLRAGGSIAGHRNQYEYNWSYVDGNIHILNSNGEISRNFKYIEEIDSFIALSNRIPFYLYPIFRHNPRTDSHLPNILINSVPKSGTYFLERVLDKSGWRPTKLHLLDWGGLDDYRSSSDEEMHTSPQNVRIHCPSSCVGAVLGRGEVVAGHLRNTNYIYGLMIEGIREIRLIRNLRNVLTSLYRFRLNKVIPEVDNEHWRYEPNDRKFFGFLKSIATSDLEEIREISEYFFRTSGFVTLKFEDMWNGDLSEMMPLCELSNIRLDDFASTLESCRGEMTSTWSGKVSNWQEFWSEEIEDIFRNSGLLDLNRKFGYEKN